MVLAISGQFQYELVQTAPHEAAEYLAANTKLTTSVVYTLFTDYAPEAISFEGCEFDAPATATLCEELAKSMTLQQLSFSGALGQINLCDVFNALVENLSVQRLDVPDRNFSAEELSTLVNSLIPYNRTIVEWNFAGNSLGDEGLLEITTALEKTAAVQKISFRRTACTTAGLERLIEALKALPCLVQLDLNENEAVQTAVLRELDHTLNQNMKLLHPTSEITHRPLVAALPPEPKKEEPTEDPTNNAAATSPPPVARRASSRSMIGRSAQLSPVPARKRHGPVKRTDQRPATLAQRPASQPASDPTRRSAENSHSEAGGAAAGASAGAAGVAAAPDTTEPCPPHRDAPSSNAAEPAPTPQPSSADGPVDKGDRKTRTEATAGAAKPPTQPASARRTRTDSPTPARERSAMRAGTPPPQRSGSATRGRSSTPSVRDVSEGAEEWREIKQRYNQFIRDPNAKPVPIQRTMPKYCLGKRVDQIKDHPSSAFLGPKMRSKTPTPAELRKYAPWNQQGSGALRSTVGAMHHVVIPPKDRDAVPTVLTFRDGGDVSLVKDDPRDIGYVARRLKQGQLQVRPSSVFSSNAPRDMRWGTTSATQVVRQAQAPGPGFYTVESELERNARKAREQAARNAGRRFGACGAPREDRPFTWEGPGPGSYEIP